MALGPRTILILSFALSVSFGALLLAEAANVQLVPVSVLRPIVGFLHLSLTPGFLLLGIIGARPAGIAELLVYAIGASMSILMILGLLLNIILPHLGVLQPMSEVPLAVGVSTSILLLGILYYTRRPSTVWRLPLPNAVQVAMQAVPITAVILGARLFLDRSANWLLLAVVAALALAPLLALYLRRDPEESTESLHARDAAFLWTVALSLLWFRALSQRYLDAFGDPFVERYFAALVQEAGRWDPGIRYIHNAMLVEVILQPLFANLLSISLDDTFKFVYPMLFAMTPVAAYCLNRRIFGREVGLISAFLIIYNPVFFNDYAQATRWGIALFFLTSILLLMTEKTLAIPHQVALILTFSFSLITSHYTTSYFFMFSLVVLCGMIVMTRALSPGTLADSEIPTRFLLLYTAFFLAALFMWYSNLAGGAGIAFLEHASIFWTGRLIPFPGAAQWILQGAWPSSVRITAFLTLLVVLLGAVGWVRGAILIARGVRASVHPVHLAVTAAYISPLILFALVGSGRALFMSLLLLAPYAVRGLVAVWRSLGGLGGVAHGTTGVDRWAYAAACLVASALLLFSSGFMSETVLKGADYAPTVFVSRMRLDSIDDPYFTYTLFRSYVPAEDVVAARWLNAHRARTTPVYVDGMPQEATIGAVTLVGYGLIPPNEIFPLGTAGEIKNAYVFLRSYSYTLGLLFRVAPFESYSVNDVGVMDMQAVYTNGLAGVFSRPAGRP